MASTVRRALVAAFAAALLLQLELVFDRPMNWDEFYGLTETHAFVEGHLTDALQVLYARVFFWVAWLPLDAIGQLRAARLGMFGFELFTTASIYAMARRFTEPLPAAIAALAYLTGGYVFQHGFSFRADPMAAALLMGALWILLRSRLDAKAIIGAALLIGLAVLATIKIVFYLPAFAGIAWLRWAEAEFSRTMLRRLLALAAAGTAFSLMFVALTILTLPKAEVQRASTTVSVSGRMMFSEGLFPQGPYLLVALLSAPIVAWLLLTAPMELKRARLPRPSAIALIGLMLPLASVVLYRNSFPYFYVFILPPVMVGAAMAARALTARFSPIMLMAALVANAAVVSAVTPREVLGTQRRILSAVHEIFPRSVAYFDFPGMVVDFPKANFFMTGWGLKRYQLGEFPSFTDVMARETVPLLLVDKEVLARNQTGPEPAAELLPQDAAALRNGFIEHWGPIWVAGRRFPAGGKAVDFPIYAPGTYTLEGGEARIDERSYAAGDLVALGRGPHRFEPASDIETRLRWGDHLRRPAKPFPGGEVFKDF
jgi:hypothetical protein